MAKKKAVKRPAKGTAKGNTRTRAGSRKPLHLSALPVIVDRELFTISFVGKDARYLDLEKLSITSASGRFTIRETRLSVDGNFVLVTGTYRHVGHDPFVNPNVVCGAVGPIKVPTPPKPKGIEFTFVEMPQP